MGSAYLFARLGEFRMREVCSPYLQFSEHDIPDCVKGLHNQSL
jgi:hypothetical protein